MAEHGGVSIADPLWRIAFRTLSPAGARARLVILIYHRVLPARDPLQPSEPTAEEFEQRMRWVKAWFNVLPLAEAVKRLANGTLPDRALAITFDDGYADNHDVALPILLKLGLPATFFIAAGFLDGGRMFNDTVIEAVRRAPGNQLDLGEIGLGVRPVASSEERTDTIAAVLERVKYLPQAEREAQVRRIAGRSYGELPSGLMMSSGQVAALHAAGMEIGGHTMTHPILAESTVNEARREIVEGRNRLQSIIGRPVRLFAYPNGQPGRDYTREHVSLVREAGFEAAVCTSPGVANGGSDLFQLPRFTPWDRELWRYGARLARAVAQPSYTTA